MASYEKEWAEDNRKKNQGSMNLLMDMDGNMNYETPRPNSRVGVNNSAREIGVKNRGGTGFLFGPEKSACTPRPGSRMQGYEAGEIHNKGVNGSMSSVLNLAENRGYESSRPAPRVRPEAQANALRNSGSMNAIMDASKNQGYVTARGAPRGVKPEAGDNALKRKGTMNLVLDQNSNSSFHSARPHGRCVKPEAAENANTNKGSMNLVFSTENRPLDAPQIRVKPEADDNYRKNRGTLTQIYGDYGNHVNSARKDPKVKGEGASIAQHGQRGTAVFLLTKYGQLPGDGRQAARVKPEARRVAKQGQGSIGALLGTQGRSNRKYRS